MKNIKDIIIFGCGKIATEFYFKYKDRVRIISCISNNEKEQFFYPEEGVCFQVARPECKGNKDSIIVICSADYENIAEQLIYLGYTPCVDFFDYESIISCIEGKEIVLFYGFCHLRAMRDYIMHSFEFESRYEGYYFPNYMGMTAYQQCRMQFFLERCSVFVYGTEVASQGFRKNMALIKRLGTGVKKLRLAPMCFGGYFPQIYRVYNNMNKYAIKCEGCDYTPFSYEDSWLNECIDKGMHLEDILEWEEVYNKDYVYEYLNKEWKRLEFQETVSDFKIIDFIKKNYRSDRLFRNESHMENTIIYQYSLQLLRFLNCSEELPRIQEPLLKCSQHIIYPSVGKALELEWDVRNELLDLYTYEGWKKVTWEEYVSCYYESCLSIKQLKQISLLP